MTVLIGIPRAMLFYELYPFWGTFLRRLGAEVVLSPPTNRAILDRGLRLAGSEVCLPIKLAFGHTAELADKVDYLFLPRLVSLARQQYNCPKVMGLTDMLCSSLEGLPPVLDEKLDLYRRENSLQNTCRLLGERLGAGRRQISQARREAEQQQQYCRWLLQQGAAYDDMLRALADDELLLPDLSIPRLKLAVIGHPYLLYDNYVNQNLLSFLEQQRIGWLTPDMLTQEELNQGARQLPRKMFWTLEEKLAAAALHYADCCDVAGIIFISSFGCGPDAITGELSKRLIRRKSCLPLLTLTMDEHSSQVGLQTRLEAFLEMLRQEVS